MTEQTPLEPETQNSKLATRNSELGTPNSELETRNHPYRFDLVDVEQLRLLSRLPPGRRLQVMLDARELAVGLIRGRLRRQYPDLSLRELNLKVLEEIDRVQRTSPGP
jgi:hypothetical protein